MRQLILLLTLALFSGPLLAANPACEKMATEKKLAGAAKNSFMKKCEREQPGNAQAMCDGKAAEKKLAGAAKNSFVKKCLRDSSAS
ncbi:hypothetical protein [Vogesella indigofera]|uniref:hypothetical protein n=1 Tax=Vogesella indigofera TaxID=45465 RepID=UPI0035AF0307